MQLASSGILSPAWRLRLLSGQGKTLGSKNPFQQFTPLCLWEMGAHLIVHRQMWGMLLFGFSGLQVSMYSVGSSAIGGAKSTAREERGGLEEQGL